MAGIIVILLLVVELIAGVAIGCSSHTCDYQTDLRNISYQLSRIADALNRTDREGETDALN